MSWNQDTVQENAEPTRGYLGGSFTDISYDATGNIVTQTNKSLTNVEYNYLDLPERLHFPSGTITNYYTADGRKLKSITDDNGTVTERYYEDGIEFEDGKLVAIYHDEGRIVLNGDLKITNGSLTSYAEWVIRDHPSPGSGQPWGIPGPDSWISMTMGRLLWTILVL